MAHQISIFAENRPGRIERVTGILGDAGINVFAASGVTDGKGGYGYVIHVRPDDFESASNVLEAK